MRQMCRKSFSERTLLVTTILLTGVLLCVGWHTFWFLTDDAYIAFRYISNARLGYGYVWNAPPFLPVEGYSSFLWVVLLDGVWRVFGIEPPNSANWVALGFSYGTFLLAARMVYMKSIWHEQFSYRRTILIGLLAFFLIFNRTFLAWSSSGLETAMFNFFLILWISVSLSNLPSPHQACLTALVSAVIALTRPDGILFCACTAMYVLFLAFREPERRRTVRILLCGFLPFGIVLAHIAWRVSFYGAWLPNTYYAKVVKAWPESGLRYMLSFVLEYALWLPFAVIIWAVIQNISTSCFQFRASAEQKGFLPTLMETTSRVSPLIMIVGTLLFHLGYYTFVVGGDHFEYRVYAHLIPLIFVALVWASAKLRFRWNYVVITVFACLLMSMPVQWTHWMLTKDLSSRAETHVMRVSIAPQWPKAVRWYAKLFDKLQSWLIYHHVCMRHQEHKVFWQEQRNSLPSREKGKNLSGHDYPVIALPSVGVPSWVLPHVNIIDVFGLNDFVIARAPMPPGSKRFMAHSRHPPKGYIESYQPNLHLSNRGFYIAQRPEPFTRDRIAKIEWYWRYRIKLIKKKN